MPITIPFDNSYARLPDSFFAHQRPMPVIAPDLIAVNQRLALELGIDPDMLGSLEGIAVLAGNALAAGSEPIAQAYAGHQFGNFVPQLGDGRAVLLGEVIDQNGIRRDIQLKGSGPTPFSRNGDGRAWLGPVLREYIVSEAMHAMGIPTTRALAAVSTGQKVQRESALPGAVLTRVASSHIRVGTFQYFAARQNTEALQVLTDYAIARHYPEAEGALGLLQAAIVRQAKLIAQWMSVGFIHGVMNTDNCHIAGETIDYGPCAFMDRYHPETVFSSIDQRGRYAYQNQPDIAVWNLAQLATSLLPLMGGDKDVAIEKATEAVHRFADLFQSEWLNLFRAKIGLRSAEEGDAALIGDLLARMTAGDADFSNCFRALGTAKARDQFSNPAAFDQWAPAWAARRVRDGSTEEEQATLMERTNPAVIPRNHRIEEAIQAGVAGDFAPFERLNRVLSNPYSEQQKEADLTRPPQPEEEVLQTFCGT
ncbi:protein adenylyltransferase SelO [Pseudohalocynthiibacter sp. F2068]|jgi:protein adenylyltransferase|uniref:protein adenylyltransferase SelO n=1 Tax=Pseudohalocynthiibacter sp. F2068 TaxID=2926418 RepID=UPI001FF5651F|nr:YdiU family protein [Pseudohalocynthiibacter sp. F2068]MCK0101627.1 YdiU family protein [Pseudohalocynthiibacter sp. F2068]